MTKKADSFNEPQRLTFTVEEFASRLGISRQFAYNMVSAGEIPSIRLGRRVLIPAQAALAKFGLEPKP